MTEATLRIKVDASDVKAGKKSLDDLAVSGANAEQGTKKAEKGIVGMSSAAKTAASVLATLGVTMSVGQIIQYADEWQNASNRLRLVTRDSSDLANVQKILMQTANDTRAGFAGTAELFTVLTRSTKDLGLSQKQIVDLTKTLNQSFAVSGASAGAMDGAIRQLSQGLQSGALRGDEFNSVAEQAPGILDAVAASLKMGRGELRDFAATGGITSKVLVTAIQDYADVIASDFSKAQMTFGQSMLVAKNRMMETVGTSQSTLSAMTALSAGVIKLAAVFDSAFETADHFFGGIKVLAENAAAAVYGPALGDIVRLSDALVEAESDLEFAKKWRGRAAIEEKQAAVDQIRSLIAVQEEMNKSKAATDAAANAAEAAALATQTQTNATDEVAEASKKATKEFEKQISALTDKRASLGMTERQAFIYQERIKAIANESSPAMVAAIEASAGALFDEEQQLKDSKKAADEYAKAQEEMRKAVDGQRYAVGNQIVALVEQGHKLGMTERDAAIYEERMKAIASGALPETIAAIEAMAASNYDQASAIRAAQKAEEQRAAVVTEVMGQMRNDISSAFADMMMSGENAFDAIAKSFERMIYKMVADWAAAGVMNMVSRAFGGAGGATSALGSILSGGASAAGSAAVSAATGGGAAAAGGGILSGIGGAVSSAGSSIMGAVAAIPGWGWALAGGAAIAALLGDKSTPSSNAGILLSDLPGVAADRKRDVDPFASGVDPVLFARREDFGKAAQIAESLRAADKVVMDMFIGAGKPFKISGPELAAFDETGRGFGQFFGIAAEDGKVALTAEQSISKYMQELIKAGARYTNTNVDPSGSPDQMLEQLEMALAHGSHATGLNYVPFDGYRAVLHKGERVQTANEARMADGGMTTLASEVRGLQAQMVLVARATQRIADLLRRVTRDGESLVTVAA